MDVWMATEEAYKKGYTKGYEDGLKQMFDKPNKTMFDYIHNMNNKELARWLNMYGLFDNSPWIQWFDKKYCSKCEAELVYLPSSDRQAECSYCELYGQCRFFLEMNESPDNEQVVEMWLKSEKTD